MSSLEAPDTIVLVHGLWVTPRSWEDWKAHYEAKGYTVITPAYPGFEIEVEALRENPEIIANLTVPETVDHLAGHHRSPPEAADHHGPLLRRASSPSSCSHAGSAPRRRSSTPLPTEGVRVTPLSQAKSLFPALKNPANFHKAVGFTKDEWHYAFANTLSREESDAAWERYAIAAPGNWVWAYGLLANFQPGHQATWVDYSVDRAPLLFIGGGADHIMPPAVNKSNAKHWEKSPALTEYHEFEGRWPLDLRRARLGRGRGLRPRLDARPRPRTADADDGLTAAQRAALGSGEHHATSHGSGARPSWSSSTDWRILIDPTFDPPGHRYAFGLGTSSVKTRGPTRTAESLGPIDLDLGQPRPSRRQPRRGRTRAPSRCRARAHHRKRSEPTRAPQRPRAEPRRADAR